MASPQIEQAAASTRSESEVRAARGISMLDVIRGGARPLGMSDEDFAWEINAQQRLFRALREVGQAISQVNNDCSTVSISVPEWEAFLHDSIPAEATWNERIAKARQS